MFTYMEVRIQHWMFSSVTVGLTALKQGPLLNWKFELCWVDSKLLGSLPPHTKITGTCGHARFLHGR